MKSRPVCLLALLQLSLVPAMAQESPIPKSSVARSDTLIALQKFRPGIEWRWAWQIDLNCDGYKDEIYTGRDREKKLCAAAVLGGTRPYKISVVRLDSPCEFFTLEGYSTDDDFAELGGPPQGWRRSAHCRCLRIRDGGQCEDVLLYWNYRADKLAWWYGL